MQRSRKILKTIVGFALLLLGLLILVLPTPGSALAIGTGLAFLAAEYVWAQRLLGALRGYAARLRF